jgi:hypothetical protein
MRAASGGTSEVARGEALFRLGGNAAGEGELFVAQPGNRGNNEL